MFLVILTYKVAFAEIEPHLAAHMAFVDRGFADGTFVLSGRKVPRTGGVIFARAASEADLRDILASDPFLQFDLVEVEIVAFAPTRAAEGLAALLDG